MWVQHPDRQRRDHLRSGDRAELQISAPLLDFGRAELPLPTGEEAAALDRRAIEEVGVPAPVLMENAGRSAALLLDRLFPEGPVLVLAGSGNNGGDGMVLARTLAARGRAVRVLQAGARPRPDPLLHQWPIEVSPPPEDEEALAGSLSGAGVVVDALLGTGARGAPRAEVARLIRAINAAGRPVLALDLPSGVDATTGATPGEAVGAQVTVAFGAPKLGSLLFPGRERCGRIVAVEIGLPPAPPDSIGAALITSGWVDAHRPRRPLQTHKRAEGRVLLLAGSPGMGGAAVLAARGALRAGAGALQVATAPENRELLLSAVPEAIFLDLSDEAALLAAARGCDLLAAGPGMGVTEAAARRLDRLLAEGELSGVLLDADALTLLGAGALPSFPGAAPRDRRLLTPHPGEMARLGFTPEEIRSDPLRVAREGAARWKADLLLKGAPSLIASQGASQAPAPVLVSANGSSDLARAGIGDVLTGVAAAMMARGCSARTGGALALHLTGVAANLTGRRETLLPSDLAEGVGEALLAPAPTGSPLDLPFITLDLPAPR